MPFLILLGILPSFIIAFIIYNTDKKEKEPIKELIKAFFMGVLAILLTLAISLVLKIGTVDANSDSLIRILYISFIEIALVEELCKWFCGHMFLRQNKDFNYMFDGIVYYVFVALGFATVENILYIINGNVTVAIIRAITTVPAHAFFGATIGYFYSVAKREEIKGNKKKKNINILLSLLVPILLHGFYDFCLFSGIAALFTTYVVFVVSLYVFSIDNIKKMERIDHELDSKDIHCRECGSVVENNYCEKCGKKV